MTGHEYLNDDDRFLGAGEHREDPACARAVILPVPFERTSSYGAGSAAGPAAIIDASHQVEFRDCALGRSPVDVIGGIATRTPLGCSADESGGAVADRLESAVRADLDAGRTVVTIGGEHTSIVGAIRAHAAVHRTLTVVQIDAHSDLRESYLGDPWNHACAMTRALESDIELVQVGIRSECDEDAATAAARGVRTFHAHTIHDAERAGDDWIADIVAACRGPVYVTFDCDALDPSVMPATGTPEPDGLLWNHVDRLLAALATARTVVGFDVSELAPIAGLHHPQFTVARLIYRTLGRIGMGRLQ